MNERGVASLTAILILLMSAYLIRGTVFTAGNYVDVTRNFEIETRLRLAAESELVALLENYKVPKTLEEIQDQVAADDGATVTVDDLRLRIRAKRMVATLVSGYNTRKYVDAIELVVIAQKVNYFDNGISAFKGVGCFLEEIPIEDSDTYTCELKGYFYKTI